jgi:hypothetical protein
MTIALIGFERLKVRSYFKTELYIRLLLPQIAQIFTDLKINL